MLLGKSVGCVPSVLTSETEAAHFVRDRLQTGARPTIDAQRSIFSGTVASVFPEGWIQGSETWNGSRELQKGVLEGS